MYGYVWDKESGGICLTTYQRDSANEIRGGNIRPVYASELDLYGFNKWWQYEDQNVYPYMWAEGRRYFYYGEQVAILTGGSQYVRPEIVIDVECLPQGSVLKPINVSMMIEKSKDILESVVKYTLKNISNYFYEYQNKVDLFYVAFSGGKDSLVCLDLVQRVLPHEKFKVLFGNTQMELLDTYVLVKQIQDYCRIRDIEFIKAQSTLNVEDAWRMFGPPTQTLRWCCSVMKSTPQILKIREVLGKNDFKGLAFTGVRREESDARSDYEEISLGAKIRGQYSCHPIIDWCSAEVFLYLFAHCEDFFKLDEKEIIPFNIAYKKGNDRVGCLMCPMSGHKHNYVKEQLYGQKQSECLGMNTFEKIIVETSAKALNDDNVIKAFMNNIVWKVRRSGLELNFADNDYVDDYTNGVLVIKTKKINSDWKEWIKTIGVCTSIGNGNYLVEFKMQQYLISVQDSCGGYIVSCKTEPTKDTLKFLSLLKNVFRKAAYCVSCRVCEANCPYGYITMVNGVLHINDNCTKCHSCHDIGNGCLRAESLRLPKGETKLKSKTSMNCFGDMGVKTEWVEAYFELEEELWDSPLDPGNKKTGYLKRFLSDSEIRDQKKKLVTPFGRKMISLGPKDDLMWALVVCNLVYEPFLRWWVTEVEVDIEYSSEQLSLMLNDTPAKDKIISSYKNLFWSNKTLGNIGFGNVEVIEKSNGTTLVSAMRSSWQNPNPLVILYALYKFAEKCGDYYEFTLTRLLDHKIESDGISPTQIFGLGREVMKPILLGLATDYPEYIYASFTHDLDNIKLRSDKTSMDVLDLI